MNTVKVEMRMHCFVFGSSHDTTSYTTSDWLGPGTKQPYREATVFWKRHAGGPLCLDPMIQNNTLLQIGLAQEQNNAMQGGHCITETPYRETIVF